MAGARAANDYWFNNGMSFAGGGAGTLARYAWMSVRTSSETTFFVKGGMVPAG